jgi:hypothetical protein
MNRVRSKISSLDAAMDFGLNIGCHWRGASEFLRYP